MRIKVTEITVFFDNLLNKINESNIHILIPIIVIAIWVYGITVFVRAKTNAYTFLWGSIGFFIISMIWFRPCLIRYINFAITAVVGFIGQLTNEFEVIYTHSTIYVNSLIQGVFLQIDVECSGVIEILVFLSLIMFFDVYTIHEKLCYGIIGILYIIFANAVRISVICFMVYTFGYNIYHIAHSYVGRIIFYIMSIIMYFYIFTKPQIDSMKVGDFKYNK